MRMAFWIWLFLGFTMADHHKAKEEPETLNSGIAVRINQKAVDYIADRASEILHHLLEEASLPTIEGDWLSLDYDYVRIYEFARPIIDVRFVKDKGINVNLTITHAYIMGQAVYGISEHFQLTISNKSIIIEMEFSRDPKEVLMKIDHCSISDDFVKAEFDGWVATQLSSTIEQRVHNAIREAICHIAVNELISIVNEPPKEVPQIVRDFIQDLWLTEHQAPPTAMDDSHPSLLTVIINSLRSSWGIDLQMPYLPKFSDEHVTIGLGGGITYEGKLPNVEPPPSLMPNLLGEKMFGVMISDYLMSTAIAHILNNKVDEFEFHVGPEYTPSEMCSIFKTICTGSFNAKGKFNLTRQSAFDIIKDGSVHVVLAGSTSLTASNSKTSYEISDATSYMNLILRAEVKANQIILHVEIVQLRVEVQKLTVGDEFSIEKFMWKPVLELEPKVMEVPSICGLQLINFSLDYADRAIILQSDITYDVDLFVREFKKFANNLMTAGGNERKAYQI